MRLKEEASSTDLTLEKAITSTQLSKFKKEVGQDTLIVIMSEVIRRAYRLSGVEQDPEIIIDIASEIVSNFWYAKIQEIILGIKNGMSGKYGKMYGKLNYIIIAEWINNVITERVQYIDDNYIRHKVIGEERSPSEPNKLSVSDMKGIVKANKDEKTH